MNSPDRFSPLCLLTCLVLACSALGKMSRLTAAEGEVIARAGPEEKARAAGKSSPGSLGSPIAVSDSRAAADKSGGLVRCSADTVSSAPSAPPEAAASPMGPCSDCCVACDGDSGWANGWDVYPRERFYFSKELLLWFVRGSPLPPLVTTGPPMSSIPGAIGQPGTQVLFGGREYNTNLLTGGRFMLGGWLDSSYRVALELGGFFLDPHTTRFDTSSGGLPILARPFTNVNRNPGAGLPSAQPIADGPLQRGAVSSSLSLFLWGTEANLRSNMWGGPGFFVDCIGGFRNLNLYETLSIDASLNQPLGSQAIHDSFSTHNNFFGGQLGLAGRKWWGRWSVNVFGKVALGVTQQVINIGGTTAITTLGGSQTLPGGLLAQPSNSGEHVRNVFGVIPEVGCTVGYQITRHFGCFVGYNFLYWSNVVRPGSQIDLRVNTSQTAPLPAALFSTSDFWAQGILLGLMARY